MTLTVPEFLRRFLWQVLPIGFVRIRYFGLFAHRRRKELLPLCLRLLNASAPQAFDEKLARRSHHKQPDDNKIG